MNFLPAWPLTSNALFFFGFLLFCGALGGYVTHRWPWLPSITGFMLVGLIAGPNVLGLVDYAALANSRIIVDVALGLILYRLGLSLDIKLLVRDRSLIVISLVESTLTFVVVFYGMDLMGVHGLAAAVIAAIAVSSSPAVLIHVANEMGASGPVTERAKSLVALNNVLAFLIFSALLPLLYNDAAAPLTTILGGPLYQLLGSTVLGASMGMALHMAARKTKEAHQYHLALVVGAVAFTLGAAMTLKLSTLFAPLVLGIVVRSIERTELIANIEFGAAFELFFIALFVYAGANLHVAEMVQYAPAALVLVFGRSLAKWLGVGISAHLMGTPKRQAATTGLLLIPMAGLAIGLADTTLTLFQLQGAVVSSVVLAAVAVLETIGPPISAKALRWSGDTLKPDTAYEEVPPEPTPQA
ncbi:MAG: cation:proton antiporter [Gammaproteobacteria bacterium]|uniref:cation:proton antiporter n=1 Tax=Rhodoferax sp. TaxID=50421 RepID=UPI0017D2C048|nr:cation:proton antiporter [Rhodoferax sp.]MBU3900962.1 cation:proton antiporter [Gammaproteobacteria bacterium]MBA3056477.1 peptidase [Rhodoferax sp.]MBU3996809.1 cation:proton antiporter [Gammaproteobacteria bacterium]MBU4017636.1 cation:proton antiporter [Gammaproteobacteria bacterium]MBU4081079.1 cation:proton antiporter [Gammaproteobacteria bacterium]